MDPLDYTSAFNNLPSPNAAFMQGVKDGAGIQQMQAQKQAATAAQQQKDQMNADMAALAQNPTATSIAQFSIKYPQLSEQMKRSYDMIDPVEKQSKLEHLTEVYSAFNANKPEIALKLMRDQATAMRNSGDERGASATEAMAESLAMDPTYAKIHSGKMLFAMAGPEKFAKAFGDGVAAQSAEDQAPANLRAANANAGAAESDATTKAVTAKYADQAAVLDLSKKGWDIKAITEDIEYKKQQNRIAAMNAAANREGNALKRQELQLKINDAITARDEKVRGKAADAESAALNIDNMLNTIQRIKKNPSLNSVLGSLEGKDYYPNSVLGSVNPFGDGDERADAIKLIDTLGSQAFLSQIPNIKGMGSLSNAEGEKLQAAFQNLSRAQSEKQFNATLDEASRLLVKGRGAVEKRYGVPLGTPDTPAMRSTRPPLESFNKAP